MSTFLHDLYRYRRRDSKHQREDYLSTCMAELMRRDQVACRTILTTLHLDPPDHLRPRVVHTQLTLELSRDRPDVRVRVGEEADRWECLIECKVDAAADRSQIRRYAQGGRRVAFVAPESTIGALGPEWDDVARASWQDVHQALVAVSATVDPDHVPPFRREFLGLLSGFGLASLPDIHPSKVRAAVAATGRLGHLNHLLKEAVQQIGPDGITFSDDWDGATGKTAAWQEDTLGVGWESDKAPRSDLPLEGLYLEASIPDAAGDEALAWVLYVYGAKRFRKAQTENALALGFAQVESDDYWNLTLHEVADPTLPFRDQCEAAVVASRNILQELGCAVGAGAVQLEAGIGAEPLPAVMYALRTVSHVSDGLSVWESTFRSRLLGALLAAGMTARETRRGRRRLELQTARGKVSVGTWQRLDGDGCHLGVWLGVGGPTSQALHAAFQHDTLQSRVGKSGNFDLLLPVEDVAVSDLVAEAVEAAMSVLVELYGHP